jgi:hypothetical protein
MGWLAGYTYRKAITLSRASGAVNNYQCKLLLGESSGATGEDVDCGAKCQTDFDDIRFTTSDGTTLLDYWIESLSGATPNQLATIWIEFNTINTTATTFYMYYGNATATAVSSGPNTFIFFDHFDTLNETFWPNQVNYRVGSVSVASSELILTGVTGVLADMGDFGNNYAVSVGKRIGIRAKNVTTDAKSRLGCSNIYAPYNFYGDDDIYVVSYADATRAFDSHNNAAETENMLSNYSADTYITFYMKWTTTPNRYDDATQNSTITTNIADEAISPRLEQVVALKTCKVDWFFIGSALATEPAWGSWGVQEDYYIAKLSYYPHILAH